MICINFDQVMQHLIGFIILVVYRSLIDGGFSHETTPWLGPGLSLPSGLVPQCLETPGCLTPILTTTFVQREQQPLRLSLLPSPLYKVGCYQALAASYS